MVRLLFFICMIGLGISPTFAQEKINNNPDDTSIIPLMIHGVILDKEQFEYRLQSAIQSGQTDTPSLRLAIREDLYNRALLLEEVKRLGISRNKTVKLIAQENQENFYIDLVMQEYLKEHPITTEQLKAEYQKQLQQLGPKGMVIEYHLAILVTTEEKQALDLLKRAAKESFSKLAIDNSVDPSAPQGGDIGWVSVSQLQDSLKQAVLETTPGNTAQKPIQVGSRWHLIKVINRREGRPASFEASQDRMKSAVIQKLKNDYIESLRQAQKSK